MGYPGTTLPTEVPSSNDALDWLLFGDGDRRGLACAASNRSARPQIGMIKQWSQKHGSGARERGSDTRPDTRGRKRPQPKRS